MDSHLDVRQSKHKRPFRCQAWEESWLQYMQSRSVMRNFSLRYSRVGKSNSQILAPAGSSLDTALVAFERFFEEYTGKSWALRGNGILPQPKRDSAGNLLPPHEGWYIYEDNTNMFLDFIQKGSASTTDAFGK
ncbi:unnamed protein product [Aspergillus oryzae RIB40]|uniref:DNA, SC012 n=1 Tax=Aspergillus oryzae (strain ATCC 42149 / RIB 40) TaxID=510516 RepID=Q2UCH9_ASPOR|nr:unnamed protein product [Aspergillus oryzae RIB40]BAE60736.1 unnamed protein product [Aspergillus oryzae RIB40]